MSKAFLSYIFFVGEFITIVESRPIGMYSPGFEPRIGEFNGEFTRRDVIKSQGVHSGMGMYVYDTYRLMLYTRIYIYIHICVYMSIYVYNTNHILFYVVVM